MTGGEWSSLSNYRSCCELAEAKVLLGFSHNRIFTRVTRVCAFDFIFHAMFLHVCVQLSVYSLWLGHETWSFTLVKFEKQKISSQQCSWEKRVVLLCVCVFVRVPVFMETRRGHWTHAALYIDLHLLLSAACAHTPHTQTFTRMHRWCLNTQST